VPSNTLVIKALLGAAHALAVAIARVLGATGRSLHGWRLRRQLRLARDQLHRPQKSGTCATSTSPYEGRQRLQAVDAQVCSREHTHHVGTRCGVLDRRVEVSAIQKEWMGLAEASVSRALQMLL
jgi:hypothetical protein